MRARSGRQTSATRADARELFDRMPDRILPDSLTDRPPTPGFNRRRRPKRMRMPRTKQKMQLFRTPPGRYRTTGSAKAPRLAKIKWQTEPMLYIYIWCVQTAMPRQARTSQCHMADAGSMSR
ncbi:hypothetical protein BDA96_01G182300 [Sorghum bicolor]|uniref:Uncharacterized protein n=2 Tax=Sorghum bicolor TaxID=4558 RepID=A0A921V0I2_SORBI|nr:hypothetical protein BDA96_01G182300 [Sorghum bicolor]OQU91405.1 hypothetical protein SORBI_3001G174150 [Sorghum bicolor]